jgi:hypothetical protein
MKSNKKIYWILTFLLLGGYAWLGFQSMHNPYSKESATLCMFKNITSIPCPACGTTRAVLLLINGNIKEALWLNPLSILISMGLILLPAWILLDVLTQRFTLEEHFRYVEQKIKTQKIIYIPLITLLLMNWCWNIVKDL